VAHAGEESTLAIQREERAFVRQVVGVQRDLPPFAYQARAQVDQIVRRQLRIGRERGLGQPMVFSSNDSRLTVPMPGIL
jgi:hypothetical protein